MQCCLGRGGRGRGAFLIRSGQITLPGNVNVYPAHMLGPEAVIGLPATFSGEPYSLTAEVVRDCHLDFIPRRRLLDLLRQNPDAGFQIVRLLSLSILQGCQTRFSVLARTRRRRLKATISERLRSSVEVIPSEASREVVLHLERTHCEHRFMYERALPGIDPGLSRPSKYENI